MDEFVTTQELRVQMASLHLKAVFSCVNVAKRTGHCGVNTIMKYKSLQGDTGTAQQRSFLIVNVE